MRRLGLALAFAGCAVAAANDTAIRGGAGGTTAAATATVAPDGPAPPAGSTAAAANRADVAPFSGATLVVFNRPVVRFRATVLGVPPSERAAAAGERVTALLDRGGSGEVTVEPIKQGAVVKVDGAFAFVLAHEDAGPFAGDAVRPLRAEAARRLRLAIAETREVRDSRQMLRSGAWAAVATAIYALAMFALVRLGRVLDRRGGRFVGEAAQRLRVGGVTLLDSSRAQRTAHWLLHASGWALALLVTYQWLGVVLGHFPFTRPWGEHLNTSWSKPQSIS